MVEVDKERGRIGLRLADDPEIAGKSTEELAAVGTGDRGPRSGGDRGDRRPRGGGRDRAATGAAAVAAATAADHRRDRR